MRALVYEGERNIDFREVSRPVPGPGELLLKPLYVGLCFTEMHSYLRDVWSWFPKGIIFGHEGSGEVIDIGPDVNGDWKIGDSVAVNPIYSCGECLMCRAGYRQECENPSDWYPTMCTDAYVVPQQCCFKVPEGVSDLAAAHVEALTVGTRAVRHSGMAVGDNVVFLGVDDYGMGALQWVRHGGAGKVIVVDPIENRRAVALKLDADAVLDPKKDRKRRDIEVDRLGDMEFIQKDRNANKAAAHPYPKIRDEMPFGPDIVFISIEMYIPESLDYIADALKMVRFGGQVIILRAYYGEGGMPNFLGQVAWLKEVSIRHFGVFYGEEPWRGGADRGDYALTLQELARGGIDGEISATKIIPWGTLKTKADVEAVYNLYPQEPKIFFKF